MTKTLEELQAKRKELVEAVSEMDFETSKVEIYELYGKIDRLDDAIHAIDPSKV